MTNRKHAPTRHATGIARSPGKTGGRRPAHEARALAAVVVTMRVTGTLVMDDVKLKAEGLKLQALSAGRPEHVEGESVAEPVRPFFAVNVRIVDPDSPGLATVTLSGLAAIVKLDRACVLKNSQVEEMFHAP